MNYKDQLLKRLVIFQNRYVLWVFFFIVASISISNTWELKNSASKIPSVVRGEVVVFYEEMSPKMRISNIDATDDFIYFAYSTYGIVAVYDWDGSYQYSLAFFSNTNGSLGMRLDNGLLYVHDNEGYEFIFSGNELIQKLAPAERMHTIGWFHSKANIPVYAESGQLYSQSGEFIMALPGKLT